MKRLTTLSVLAVTVASSAAAQPPRARPRVGIDVLLDEQVSLIRRRRVALVADDAAVNEHGESDESLLRSDARARAAQVEFVGALRVSPILTRLGSRPTPTGAPDVPGSSLDLSSTLDSLAGLVQVLLVDLQDVGTRSAPTLSVLDAALRAARRRNLTLVILDRPNPITGTRVDGPVPDSSARRDTPTAPTALYAIPLRHGMTTGELAEWLNRERAIGASLTVVPLRGWRRSMWLDEWGLRWRAPWPLVPSLESALLFSGLSALEATNLALGQGTDEAFQVVGATWLRSREVADLLNDRLMAGVRFRADRVGAADAASGRVRQLPGVRIVISDRDRANPVRIAVAVLWAALRTTPDSLRVDAAAFDRLMGTPRVREALLRGEDPDEVLDREVPAAVAWREGVRRSLLYR
jgi:uncharacterized protein YbbC (DUF1343 family)